MTPDAAGGAFVAPGAFAEESKPVQEPKPAQIDRNGVIILIRSTLLALDDANKTGNYSVLRDLGAPGFKLASSRGNSCVRKYSQAGGSRKNSVTLIRTVFSRAAGSPDVLLQ